MRRDMLRAPPPSPPPSPAQRLAEHTRLSQSCEPPVLPHCRRCTRVQLTSAAWAPVSST